MLGEPRSEHLHVGAEVLQPIGMVDRGSGMERGHDGEVPRLVEASAQLGHAELGLQDELRGEVAQAHDHVGPDAADLLAQKRRAGLDLLGFGVAVAGWAALHHIGDVDVLAAQTRLGEQIETGTILNATPSKEVFGNIFYPKTPLHDGAVIMRDGMILAAACFLPKPQNDAAINKKLGSRHRAAIGMSENSDAVVIVVSEETGQISVAMNGVLTRDFTREKLKALLEKEIFVVTEDGTERKNKISSLLERRKKK